MRVLILPDVHTHYNRAEKIIDFEAPDLTIFLGDYFDEWRDTPESNKETAIWLKESVNKKNRIHLIGNHDVSYINKTFACSGFTESKYKLINEVCNWENTWGKLHWFYNLDNEYLLTHAGLHTYHLPPNVNNYLDILSYLERQSRHCNIYLQSSKLHWFYSAGFARGGSHPIGGIVWLDFKKEFEEIPFVKQIIGHTPIAPDLSNKNGNINLDSFNKLSRYAIYSNKTLEIKNYAEL